MSSPPSKQSIVVNALRKLTVGSVTLLGALLLANLAAWLYYLIYGLLYPSQVRPSEDWDLGLGILSLTLQIGAVVIALVLCLLIRYRWLTPKLGQAGIWLFTGIALSQVLFGIHVSYPAQVFGSILWGVVVMSPLASACLWVSRWRLRHRL